jgi:hypothetical protein
MTFSKSFRLVLHFKECTLWSSQECASNKRFNFKGIIHYIPQNVFRHTSSVVLKELPLIKRRRRRSIVTYPGIATSNLWVSD